MPGAPRDHVRLMRLIVAALAALGPTAGFARGASAQASDLTAKMEPVQREALPGTTVEVTAVFTPESALRNYDVSVTLSGMAGSGTIAATPVSITPGLTGCAGDAPMRSFACDGDNTSDSAQLSSWPERRFRLCAHKRRVGLGRPREADRLSPVLNRQDLSTRTVSSCGLTWTGSI